MTDHLDADATDGAARPPKHAIAEVLREVYQGLTQVDSFGFHSIERGDALRVVVETATRHGVVL